MADVFNEHFINAFNFYCTSCRYFISFEGLIIVHMILALMLKYSVFLLGTTATSNPVLCGVCSGLLHFITLSFFSSAAVHSLFLFISYYGLSKQSKKSLNMCSYLLLLWGKQSTATLCYKVMLCLRTNHIDSINVPSLHVTTVVSVIVILCSCLIYDITGLPLVTVILTAAVGHKYYSNSYL